MNQKRAHKIIKSSKGVSEISSTWKIEVLENSVFISNEFFNSGYYVTFDFFMKKIFNKVIIEDNKVIGEYRFSSVGFITEDEYLFAQDLVQSKKIKRVNLEYGHIYLSSNGSRYVYLKNTDIQNFEVSEDYQTIRRLKNPFSYFFLAKLRDDNSIEYISMEKSIRLIEHLEAYPDFDILEEQVFRRMTYGENLFISNKKFKFPRLNMKDGEFFYIDMNMEDDENLPTVNLYSYYFREDKYHVIFINKFRFLRDFLKFINSNEETFDLTRYKTDKIYQSHSYYEISEDEIPF